jgi:hypothetical protein
VADARGEGVPLKEAWDGEEEEEEEEEGEGLDCRQGAKMSLMNPRTAFCTSPATVSSLIRFMMPFRPPGSVASRMMPAKDRRVVTSAAPERFQRPARSAPGAASRSVYDANSALKSRR